MLKFLTGFVAAGIAFHAFCRKHTADRKCWRRERALRQNLSERQIDRMVEDSFPCSDPPSTY